MQSPPFGRKCPLLHKTSRFPPESIESVKNRKPKAFSYHKHKINPSPTTLPCNFVTKP